MIFRGIVYIQALAFFIAGFARQNTVYAQASLPEARIGIVFDGPADSFEDLLSRIKEETHVLTQASFQLTWENPLIADWSLEGASGVFDQLLENESIDIIVTFGVLSSFTAAQREGLPKPVIAPFIIDPVLQGLPHSEPGSGLPNFNYLVVPNTVQRDLKVLAEITGARQIAMLMNDSFVQAAPDLDTRISSMQEETPIQLVVISDDIEQSLAALAPETDAIYALPMPQLSPEAREQLIDQLIARGLPSFAYGGVPEVEQGFLASLNPDLSLPLSRRVGLNLHRILLGDDVALLPTVFAAGEQFTLNMETARAIGYAPPIGMLLEARLLHPEIEVYQQTWMLETAVMEGVKANLILAAEQRSVQAGAQNVLMARSTLRPQLDIAATGLLIDEDRAEASFGAQAQRTLSGAVTLRQVIYSEPAFANVAIQRWLQEAREYEFDIQTLDVAQLASNVYLNVLRAKTFERIQQENLQLSRTNLELARVRQQLGQARAGEVLRWESEVARSRQKLIDAFSQRQIAGIALNQALNRPLEESFDTAESTENQAPILLSEQIFQEYVTTIPSANKLREFMVAEGLDHVPELKAFEAAIASRKRLLESKNRAFWSPTIALQGQAGGDIAEGGAGSSGIELPNTLPDNLFPRPDHVDWSVGVNVSLPLTNGGRRSAEQLKAREELAQLEFERDLARQRIEQQIRSAMYAASASFASIKEAEAAATAARETLELVTEAYRIGAVDAVDVLEAQNTALITSEVATNAVYDFRLDLMQVERAIGVFDFFRTPQERADFLRSLQDFMANN